jgi:hypothetical protein
MKGNRAFAQAQYHGVTASFYALGNRDLAFTAKQFHRAHFAQIHADGIIGALAGAGLFGRIGYGTRIIFADIVDGFNFVLGI